MVPPGTPDAVMARTGTRKKKAYGPPFQAWWSVLLNTNIFSSNDPVIRTLGNYNTKTVHWRICNKQVACLRASVVLVSTSVWRRLESTSRLGHEVTVLNPFSVSCLIGERLYMKGLLVSTIALCWEHSQQLVSLQKRRVFSVVVRCSLESSVTLFVNSLSLRRTSDDVQHSWSTSAVCEVRFTLMQNFATKIEIDMFCLSPRWCSG
jgi:hypothetical protein